MIIHLDSFLLGHVALDQALDEELALEGWGELFELIKREAPMNIDQSEESIK